MHTISLQRRLHHKATCRVSRVTCPTWRWCRSPGRVRWRRPAPGCRSTRPGRAGTRTRSRPPPPVSAADTRSEQGREDTELPCLGIAVGNKVHADILADGLMHGPHFPGYEAEVVRRMGINVCLDTTCYLHHHQHSAELKIFVIMVTSYCMDTDSRRRGPCWPPPRRWWRGCRGGWPGWRGRASCSGQTLTDWVIGERDIICWLMTCCLYQDTLWLIILGILLPSVCSAQISKAQSLSSGVPHRAININLDNWERQCKAQ